MDGESPEALTALPRNSPPESICAICSITSFTRCVVLVFRGSMTSRLKICPFTSLSTKLTLRKIAPRIIAGCPGRSSSS